MMVGAKVDLNIERPKPENVKPRLIIDGINCKDKENVKTLDDVDLTVNTGEILGIAGISGSGQKELLEAIAGLQNVESGSIRLLDDNGGEMDFPEWILFPLMKRESALLSFRRIVLVWDLSVIWI